MPSAWPLIGRSQEMQVVEAALSDEASAGVVICGAAGVGKTRIAREAVEAAASNGFEVRWVVGSTSAREVPMGALASWCAPTGGDTLQLVREAIELLSSGPTGAAVVVGVDDVHLLDDLSLFVLQQIVQRRAAKLVLTMRSGDPIPAAAQELWREGQFARIDVQPLSHDETATLVSATLKGALDPAAAQRLWRLTHGNVLYLRNIVEQEVSDGRLINDHGYWRWIGEPIIPPGLVELIEMRMGALPGPVSDVIDALAIGEPLELAALTEITAAAAVEEADMRRLITLEAIDGGMEVRLAHPLYGEVRRRRAPATRLRRLRGLVATELAKSDERDNIRTIVRRATLIVDSDLPPDPDLLTRAAKGALWLADHGLAERLAKAASRTGGGPEANLIRAHALTWLGRAKEADKVFAAVDTRNLTDEDRAALAFAHAATRLYHLADAGGAKSLVDEVSRTLPPEAHRCIDAFFIVYWATMGKPGRAREIAKNVMLDALPDIVGALPARLLVMASGDAGQVSEAARVAAAGYSVVDRSLDAAGVRAMVADAHVRALLQAGRVSEAQNTAEWLRQQAADLPGSVQMLSSAVVARAALGAGRLGTASEILKRVMETWVAAGPEEFGDKYHFLLQRTIALAMRGMTDEVVAALAELEQQRHPSWRCLDYEAQLARAWTAAAQGATTDAIALSLSAAQTAMANGQFGAEVLCRQTAAQFGDGSSAARLRELEAIVEGPRVATAARFAAALLAGDAAELASVSDDFERMGDLVAALDAAAHAAVAYRRQNLRGSALLCSTRAERLAEQCGGASTPALRGATERLPFTDREREIAMLIGQGLSNREVAERLTLSVRTVESHIYRAMAKTGVASRDELAALFPGRKAWPAQSTR